METLKSIENLTVTEIPNAIRSIKKYKQPKLNKNNTIRQYTEQLQISSEYNIIRGQVVGFVQMTKDQFNLFCENLLSNYEWLTGRGGNYSDTCPESAKDKTSWLDLSEEERKEWRKGVYSEFIAVIAPSGYTIYVDPKGYSYARYVAFEA